MLGEKIVEVAERIRSNWTTRSSTINSGRWQSEKGVTFLLWNSNDENVSNIKTKQKHKLFSYLITVNAIINRG